MSGLRIIEPTGSTGRPPIYDGPVVKIIRVSSGPFAPFQPIIVDKFGRMWVEPTDFLRRKRAASRTSSADGIYQTARQLNDVFFVAEQYNCGAGVPLQSYSDHILEQLKVHYVGQKIVNGKESGCRGVTNAVWNAILSVILQFLLYCEKRGIITGVIGLRNSSQSYNIVLEDTNPYPVHRLASKVAEPDEVVIPGDASFEAVLAEREKSVKSPVLRRRDTLLTIVLDEGLRRSEAARLPIDVIPSAQEVSNLRRVAKASGIAKPVPIRVQGAKTGAVRVVDFSLSLVERLRDFIDEDRPVLRPEKAERSIFISNQTGRALNPQSITNQYCRARSKAISTAEAYGVSDLETRDIRRVHPHAHRHRSITDSMASKLEYGLDPLHAMLDVMNNAGITLETMLGYLHLGQSRRKSVLVKQGLVDQVKDDIVLERLRALDESKLGMISRKRRSRK